MCLCVYIYVHIYEVPMELIRVSYPLELESCEAPDKGSESWAPSSCLEEQEELLGTEPSLQSCIHYPSKIWIAAPDWHAYLKMHINFKDAVLYLLFF